MKKPDTSPPHMPMQWPLPSNPVMNATPYENSIRGWLWLLRQWTQRDAWIVHEFARPEAAVGRAAAYRTGVFDLGNGVGAAPWLSTGLSWSTRKVTELTGDPENGVEVYKSMNADTRLSPVPTN
jgi:hypothetical protein